MPAPISHNTSVDMSEVKGQLLKYLSDMFLAISLLAALKDLKFRGLLSSFSHPWIILANPLK